MIPLFGSAPAFGSEQRRPKCFLLEERKIIEDYYHRSRPAEGLPPGLQKRFQPLPNDLQERLPKLPENWEGVILHRDVILVDRRANRILDIIEDVVDLVSGC